ncbi:MAG: beta-Ala-His dipeptidase [Acetobacterium sp.]
MSLSVIEEKNVILEGVLAEFKALAKIPRQSQHEQAVSDYLAGWAKKHGFDYVQDQENNIIIEVPATAGYEKSPLTILQGHMDMVCIAAAGEKYNPLTDPIKLIRDTETLTAQGTSLGADNGIGIAMIQYMISSENVFHGPLRAIFTVNEEDGFTGALRINEKYFLDATYLINCDSEAFGEVTESCAGSNRYDFSRMNTWVFPKGELAYELSLSGLLGGHSGIEIGLDHANAIKTLGNVLGYINGNGVTIELFAFDGGQALNAIPSDAQAILVIASKDLKVFEELMAAAVDEFKKNYAAIEKNYKFTYERTKLPDKVLSEADGLSFLNLIAGIQDGVHTISPFAHDLIESSSNLGLAKIGGATTTLNVMARSSQDDLLAKYTQTYQSLGQMAGFDLKSDLPTPGWAVDPDNPLKDMYAKAYKDYAGQDVRVMAIHAGLECGSFAKKNPKLKMISVGPDLSDIHTPNETLVLSSIAPSIKVLAKIFADMK